MDRKVRKNVFRNIDLAIDRLEHANVALLSQNYSDSPCTVFEALDLSDKICRAILMLEEILG